MIVSTESKNNIKILYLKGELNTNTSSEAETRMNHMIMGGNKKIIVNLKDLSYISSAGLRIFLIANKLTTKKDGALRICCLNETVKEVFEISGFHMIFELFNTEEEALANF